MLAFEGSDSKFFSDRSAIKFFKKKIPKYAFERLCIPGPVTVKAKRYVSISGAWCHDAQSEGLLWIDIKDRIIIGASATAGVACPKKSTSDFVPPIELPKEYLDTVNEWRGQKCQDEKLHISTPEYSEASELKKREGATVTYLALPLNQLRRDGGPSSESDKAG